MHEDINTALKRNGIAGEINTKYKLAFMFGQMTQETLGGRVLEEDLRYPAPAALDFSYFKKHGDEAFAYGKVTKKFIDFLNTHPAEARKYGKDAIKQPISYKEIHPANPEAIANRAYGGRLGNGGVQSGDGWKYRGRGLLQLTFKDNYKENQKNIVVYFGEKVDFVNHPDLVKSNNYATKSALAFWSGKGIGSAVDSAQQKGGTVTTINYMVTRKVNGGKNGFQSRLEETKKILSMSFFELCKDAQKEVKKVAMGIATFIQLAWNGVINQGVAERTEGGNV